MRQLLILTYVACSNYPETVKEISKAMEGIADAKSVNEDWNSVEAATVGPRCPADLVMNIVSVWGTQALIS